MNHINPKILIVEDESDWSDRHREWLEEEGFTDITALGNLHEALGLMDTIQFSLLIVDGLGGNWRKFAEKGKELGIRTIVISAQSVAVEEKFRRDVGLLGAEFINKNVFFDEQRRETTIKGLADSVRQSSGREAI